MSRLGNTSTTIVGIISSFSAMKARQADTQQAINQESDFGTIYSATTTATTILPRKQIRAK